MLPYRKGLDGFGEMVAAHGGRDVGFGDFFGIPLGKDGFDGPLYRRKTEPRKLARNSRIGESGGGEDERRVERTRSGHDVVALVVFNVDALSHPLFQPQEGVFSGLPLFREGVDGDFPSAAVREGEALLAIEAEKLVAYGFHGSVFERFARLRLQFGVKTFSAEYFVHPDGNQGVLARLRAARFDVQRKNRAIHIS